ncbi:FAD-dependent thymidylate synthase [Metasolibacillus meyeri]|uniref:FAD-dependent thymidylate synthase n=1 Tax=Metasolibacillus meyeri TaxID=1071052 RepID=UPI000D30ED65|nr:FAD-dependent thymidylate synthase [Metasolibacillus meyeri]
MNITLLGHTQLSLSVIESILNSKNKYLFFVEFEEWSGDTTDGQVIALAAIRQCYSHKTALEVLETESEKYFGDKGQEGKRLFNHIVKSGHTSTLEHIHFTFAVEGVSRALLAQLTRHRQLSFSVQSQRYNKFSSDSRSGGFDYVIPESVYKEKVPGEFQLMMTEIQKMYDKLINFGIPQEDARAVLPNAATCNLVVSGNLRAWLEFYSKRKKGNGAQAEIAEFAECIKNAIIEVESWTSDYFES